MVCRRKWIVCRNEELSMKKSKIYILLHGYKGSTEGYPLAAFKNKKDLLSFVKEKHPEMKAKCRIEPKEMYWQSEDDWMMCDSSTDFFE